MNATLILSHIEQAAVLQHLTTQYDHLCRRDPTHADCDVLHRLMTRVSHDTTLGLTEGETHILLRCLRAQHRQLAADMMALEERRIRGGHNGALDGAHDALDAEAVILADVLRRLWEMLPS